MAKVTKTKIGRVMFLNKGTYNVETAYSELDVVKESGRTYICLKNCKGIQPTNTEYWILAADIGISPINKEDYNTEEEKSLYANELFDYGKIALDEYTAEKVEQLIAKEVELEGVLDTEKDKQIGIVNDKAGIYNANAETKTLAFNTNASDKTAAFDTNAETKTSAFNTNASEKISAFNTNVNEKTSAFNANAESKTSAFNTNASEKTASFNQNASDKVAEFDDVKDDLLGQADDLFDALTTNEASGNELYIDDAKACRILNTEIGGMHKQETTKGINLINVNEQLNNTINGITKRNNKDGSLTLTGTATAETRIQLRTGTLEEGKYTYKCFGNQTDCVTNIYYIGNVTKENIRVFTVSANSTNNYVFMYVIPESTTINVTIKPMLVNGEYTADTFPDFEPFTGGNPSPNPNYPQKIKTVVGSVEIDIVNKNFLDIEDIEEIERGGIKYSVKNGILKLNGTSTASFEIQLSKNIKIKKGKYTHSSNYIQSGLYISFDNLGYTMLSATVGKKRTFELKEDKIYTKYFIWIDKGIVLNNVEIKPQLEKGDTTTNFIEHQSQTSVMPIQQEMLEGDYISDVEHHGWRKIVLDGTEKWEETTTNNLKRFFCKVNVIGINNNSSVNCISNYFKSTSRNKLEFSSGDEVAVSGEFLNILSKNIKTKEDFKAYLKQQFDSENPVIVYYKLAEPVDLELTEEQKEVKKRKLYTYEDITNVSLSDELASCKLTYVQDVKKLLEQTQAIILNNASEEVTEE